MKINELEFFKSISLFQDLTMEEISLLANILKRRDVKKDSIIVTEGDQGETMYLFMEGKVEVTHSLTMKIGKKGFEETEKSMARLDAQHFSFFGDMAMLSDAPRSATVKALTGCVLFEMNKDDFLEFCEYRSDLGYKILTQIAYVLCDRIRKGNEDILKLTTALSIALSK